MKDDEAALLRQFESMVSGADLADLRALVGQFLAGDVTDDEPAPDRRRPRRDETVLYRVRVDLQHSRPPIWRRLDLRSDLNLLDVHQVLQDCFGWTDSHLYRFALGGQSPFDSDAQWFVCPYDQEEDGGLAVAQVRLDEVLQQPGDVLQYVYDYGDDWRLTLKLEKVLPARDDAPPAVAIAGRRAGPPEDCGGLTDADDLATVMADPAHFDLAELNRTLCSAASQDDGGLGLPARLVQMRQQLVRTDVGEDVSSAVLGLAFEPRPPSDEELSRALHPYLWFLDWAHDEHGIPLTGAGYLRPADVPAAARVVPAMAGWISRGNRENQAQPLLWFRQSVRDLGLLRKRHDRMLLTKAGAAARQDPRLLWDRLVQAVLPADDDPYADSTLLLLAYVATEPGTADPSPRGVWARALTLLGWQHTDGSAIEDYEVTRLAAYGLLRNLNDPSARPDWPFGPVARLLAHTALRRAA